MKNYRTKSTFQKRNRHEPVLSATEMANELEISYKTLLRKMKDGFSLEVKLLRKNAKYYSAKDFRQWCKDKGLK